MTCTKLVGVFIAAAIIATIAILAVRGIEAHQQQQASQQARNAYCQQVAAYNAGQTTPGVDYTPVVGLYNC